MIRRSKTAARNQLTPEKIRRSVASSTAIETGEATAVIETRLKSGKRRFPQLSLAD
ncbi:hypothetical protein [uncultured Oceanisphaera sp.]|uniref:hypothetical protein n=1 Tax=uncultured Oceanisphaera sp. TaxID=353858 RepID=UPI002631231F|nr:hypothetical protein [uncultured Oceanisphaera sp.]